MKNMKKRYSEPDPDPLWNRIRIHFFQMWIRGFGSGSTIRERWIRGSDPLFPNVDPRIRIHVKMRWVRNAAGGNFIHPCSLHTLGPYLPPINFWSLTSAAVGFLFRLSGNRRNFGPKEKLDCSLFALCVYLILIYAYCLVL